MLRLLSHSTTSTPWRRWSSTDTVAQRRLGNHYDVAIIGGGLVGSSLACALASSKFSNTLKIALVEPTPIENPPPTGSPPALRVISVTPASKSFYEALGAWSKMDESRVTPFFNMEVWDGDGQGGGYINFHNSPHQGPLAYILENSTLNHAVLQRLKDFDNVDVVTSPVVEITQKKSSDDVPKFVTKANPDVYHTASLLVGADGGNSMVRKAMGTQWTGWSYNQKGVVCTVAHPPDVINGTAYQRFLPNGPIAMLPMFNGFSSIVWSTTLSEADKLLKISNEDFVYFLKRAFESPLESDGVIHSITSTLTNTVRNLSSYISPPQKDDGSVGSIPPVVAAIEGIVGPRAAFPLRFGYAQSYVAPNMALVGDAAHVVHPLAGQGVNLGIADAASLTSHIIDAIATGHLFHDESVLKRYERERQVHNAVMGFAVDGLGKLFTSNFVPLSFLRSLGLSATNAMPFKKTLQNYAMGTQLDLTRIGASNL